MPRALPVLLLLFLVHAGTAASSERADNGPKVVASIAPVHSLVSSVIGGAGAVDLLMPASSSPHHFVLKPSAARAVSAADVVFVIGKGFESIDPGRLADMTEGRIVALAETPGLDLRSVRWTKNAVAEEGHGAPDLHIWLDPLRAEALLERIAAVLAETDPARAASYQANAAAAANRLSALHAALEERMAPYRGIPFVTLHDGFGYFEDRYGLKNAGALQLTPEVPAGPATRLALHDAAREAGVSCVFREPQGPARQAEALATALGARTGVLDPLGAGLDPGPELYPALLNGLADGFAACLGASPGSAEPRGEKGAW